MPNYLAIDYGTKRIGLAWADELGIALPVGAIPGVDQDGYLEALSKEINEREITELVIGYPIHMDGSVGKRAEEVDQFILFLEQEFKLPVHRTDERLTSLAAEEIIGKKARTSKVKKSGRVDATAACLILKDFLKGKSGEDSLHFS